MNCSELHEKILQYLGYYGVSCSPETESLIQGCLKELEGVQRFQYRYKAYSEPPAFLLKEPYLAYLKGAKGVLLAVMTLGGEVDRRIKLLARTDLTRSVVFDACASAFLEQASDEYEKTLGELSYRFCPGYGGSDVSDVKEIFALLQPEKIGVTLSENFYMLPSKTMAGIIAVGGSGRQNCGDCVLLAQCRYRKEGLRCYGSENKL